MIGGQTLTSQLSEPLILPTSIPNLLVNGSSGIAVGMATNIPPHNLTEILDASLALLRQPDLEIESLLKIVKGPDFPTGGFICGRDEIQPVLRRGSRRDPNARQGFD